MYVFFNQDKRNNTFDFQLFNLHYIFYKLQFYPKYD